MKPHLDFLYKKFDEFNHLMFSDELPQIPIILTRSARSLGYLKFRKIRIGNEAKIKVETLGISSVYDRSQFEIEDTLLHEMIHLLQFVRNKYGEESQHGAFFRAEMNRLNNTFDRNIKISERNTEIANNADSVVGYLMISRFKSGEIGICRMAKTKIFVFKEDVKKWANIESISWYGTRSPILNRLKRCMTLKFYVIDEVLVKEILSHPSTIEMEFNGRYFQPK